MTRGIVFHFYKKNQTNYFFAPKIFYIIYDFEIEVQPIAMNFSV